MNIINRDWEKTIIDFSKKHYSEIKLVFVVFLIEAIVYGQKITAHSLATDDYKRFYNGGDEQASWNGRWLNEILSGTIFSGPVHILPYWNFLLGLFFITLAAYYSAKIFKLDTGFRKAVFILLCTVNPFWAENFFFNTNFPVWLFTFIGILGFYLVICYRERKFFWLIALVLITASISVYQVVLQVCLVILLFKMILETLKVESFKEIVSVIVENSSYLILLVLSVFIYSQINSLYIAQLDQVASQNLKAYVETFSESTPSVTLFQRLLGVYLSALAYISPLYFKLVSSDSIYAAENYFHFGRFQYLFVYLIGLLVMLMIVFWGVMSNGVGSSKKNFWIKRGVLVLLFLALPIIISLPSLAGLATPVRAYYPIGWVLAGGFVVSYRFPNLYRNFNLLSLLFLFIFSVYFINIFFYWAYRKTEFDHRLANQIVGVIRTHPGYEHEDQPLRFRIVGEKSFEFTGWDWGGYQEALAQPWSKYHVFKHFTDLNFVEMGSDHYKRIEEKLIAELEKINDYPSRNGIYVDGQDVILFLNPEEINSKINR